VIGDPPFDAGGVKEIVAMALPAVALPIVGAPGTVPAIVIEKLCVALPAAFVAVTTPLNVPAVVGVPVTAPEGASARPPGRVPEARLNVGAGAPLAVNVCE